MASRSRIGGLGYMLIGAFAYYSWDALKKARAAQGDPSTLTGWANLAESAATQGAQQTAHLVPGYDAFQQGVNTAQGGPHG